MTAGRAVFLGFTVPDSFAADLFRSDPIPAVQTHKFALAFASALSKVFDKVVLLSAPPVQHFPVTPFRNFAGQEFVVHGMDGVVLGASNVRTRRHLSRFLACLKMTGRLRKEWAPDVVFVHGVHTPFLAYAAVLRLFGITTVVILTDAPGLFLPTDGRVRRVLKTIDRSLVKLLLRAASGVVALAPALVEKLAPSKPNLVVPGIISDEWVAQATGLDSVANAHPFTVTYAGGIDKSYGAGLLVGAAALLPDVSFRICGRGAFYDEALATSTANVVLPGFLGQEAVAAEIMGADLLINPRPSTQGFAVLSFPSKLLEYLATGRPVLTTPISSIPKELTGSFYYITEETDAGVAAAISAAAALPADERGAFGRAAQHQALAHFGEAAVAKKLKTFLTRIK